MTGELQYGEMLNHPQNSNVSKRVQEIKPLTAFLSIEALFG